MIPPHIGRKPDRQRRERAELDALLDEVPHGVLACVQDQMPWQVPMLFARDGDRVLLHGSTGAGALRHVAAGQPVSFAVTALDAIVVSHTTFDSSANYRSAVITGVPVTLTQADARRALEVMSDRLVPGRSAEVRAINRKEMAATLAIALPIVDGQWIMKMRTGGPGQADEQTDAWRGVVDIRTTYGPVHPHDDSAERPIPASVERLVGPPCDAPDPRIS